ncbi:MAG TPA: hypothetical protein PL056_10980 [bacterium]|nr:hypothetical protein [bacterium]
MISFIFEIVGNVIANTGDCISVVDRIDGLYNRAWSNLLYIIGVGGAVVGFLIPLTIQFFRDRDLRDVKRNVFRVRGQVDSLDKDTKNMTDRQKTIDKKIVDFDKKISDLFASLDVIKVRTQKISLLYCKFNVNISIYFTDKSSRVSVVDSLIEYINSFLDLDEIDGAILALSFMDVVISEAKSSDVQEILESIAELIVRCSKDDRIKDTSSFSELVNNIKKKKAGD